MTREPPTTAWTCATCGCVQITDGDEPAGWTYRVGDLSCSLECFEAFYEPAGPDVNGDQNA